MTSVLFDALKLSEKLQTGGFSPEQSKTVSAALSESISEWVSGQPNASKADVDSVRMALRESALTLHNDIEALKIEAKTSLTTLEMQLKNRLDEVEMKLAALELRMVIKMGTMIVALGGVLIAIKYFG